MEAAPDAFVRDVAALLGVDGEVGVDPFAIALARQRDGVNDAWRERYVAEGRTRTAFAVRPRTTGEARPRLSVHVLARNAEHRLARLIAEAQSYADEVVVGIDASSEDATFDVAAAHADVAYRFALPRPAQLAPARMLAFEHASGDWILSIDDDESMEPGFESLLPELVRATHVTHYYFPRKWIVSETPALYAHAEPWFPNWAPRLFRNDRALFWKPPEPHSMYFIEGPSAYDERCAILHFEPVWCTPEQRERKLRAYRSAGARIDAEAHYAGVYDVPRRPVATRPPATPQRRHGIVHEAPRALTAAATPPWRAEIVHVDLPAALRAGERATVRVTVRNTGALAWMPTYAQWPANPWPLLRLGHHLYAGDGTPVDVEGRPRMEVRRTVRPGETATFVDVFSAPPEPGEYVVEWDMLSEGHHWFAGCGSPTYRVRIVVR